MLVLMLICLLTMYRIDASRAGRTMLTIQQADFIAESIGINVSRYKVISWTVGCFFAGIAGGFYAHYLRVLNPDSFGVLQGIYVVVYMIVGGRRRFYGQSWALFSLPLFLKFSGHSKNINPLSSWGYCFDHFLAARRSGGFSKACKILASEVERGDHRPCLK